MGAGQRAVPPRHRTGRERGPLQGALGHPAASALQQLRCRRPLPRSAAKDPSNAQAYLGLATLSAAGFDGKAAEYAAKAATLDPKLAAAHELLATLALENDDSPAAIAEADKALALDPDALDAMAIHAAVELIADRSPEPVAREATGGQPVAFQVSNTSSSRTSLELHYRYEDAVTYFRKATAAQPRLWSAHSATRH